MFRPKFKVKNILLCRQLAVILNLVDNSAKGVQTMKEKQIRVIIVEPNRPARLDIINNNLQTFQRLVGGYVEHIRLDGYDIIINEEGKYMNLVPNFAIYGGQDYVAGVAIFAAVDYRRGDMISLSDEQIEQISQSFKRRGNLKHGETNKSN
jgi:Domain of unknown function (DUF3846)